MRNLLLTQLTRDLTLTLGNFVIVADNVTYWSQKLETNLRLFFAEWFLQRNIGLDYFTNIMGKTSISDANAVLQAYIEGLDFVDEIISFKVDFDGAERKYIINELNVKIITGETISTEGLQL